MTFPLLFLKREKTINYAFIVVHAMSKCEGDVEDRDDHDEIGDDEEVNEFIEEHGYVCSQ